MPARYTINDLERLTGIKAHTLRMWEQRYNILNPKRTSTNIRYYNGADLRRILNISLLNSNGYKISRIAKLSDDEIVREAEKLLNSSGREDDQIEKLVFCLMELDALRFESIYSDSLSRFGFENTFEKIIFPFLKHTGNMWQVGTINPAQEHFISNLIRQKIISAIDAIKPPAACRGKVILYLPYGEYHEISLLYCHYMFKASGWHCIYLGPNVPAEDLRFVFTHHNPQYIVTVITTSLADTTLNEYISLLNNTIPEGCFLVSGRLLIQVEETFELPKNFKLFRDFSELRKLPD